MLRALATATIAHFLATCSPDGGHPRSPTSSARGRAGRWGKVGRFGNSGAAIGVSRGSRLSTDCSGRAGVGEEDGMEAGAGSVSSSSSLADAASFVYR